MYCSGRDKLEERRREGSKLRIPFSDIYDVTEESPWKTSFRMWFAVGIEPRTSRMRSHCSTNWGTVARSVCFIFGFFRIIDIRILGTNKTRFMFQYSRKQSVINSYLLCLILRDCQHHINMKSTANRQLQRLRIVVYSRCRKLKFSSVTF